MRDEVRCRVSRFVRIAQALLVAVCTLGPAGVAAQNIVSVPFTKGFIGTRGPSAGTSNSVLTFGTLGIARIFFVQNSSTNAFELQGNDIPGTMRIVRTNGTIVDIPASVNWRNSGGTTYLVGMLPRPASPYTFHYASGSIQITDGSAPGGTSVGGYVASYGGSMLVDGGSTSGNAALGQVLEGLNQYLGTVISSRPQGPVTVNSLTTTNTTPTLSGYVTLAGEEQLTVIVNHVQYGPSTTPAVSVGDGEWSLTLTSPLPNGIYDVVATVTNADGFTLADGTTNELQIGTSLTVSGNFTANSRVYDGTTVATGTTTGLTLQGVPDGRDVTIASVTLHFQSGAVGEARAVIISGITLGGANAGGYVVNLTDAPTASADITPRPLTIDGLTAVSRPYDGTTVATLSGTAGYVNLASGENFAVSGAPTAHFASATVGNNKPVTVSGLTAPSGNYSVTQPQLLANISTRTLTIGGSFTANDKTHDGTTAATIGSNSLRLLSTVADDYVSLAEVVAHFAASDVGTGIAVNIASATLVGAEALNYTLSLVDAPSTTAAITSAGPTTLTVGGTLSANSRMYDGTSVASGSASGLTLHGISDGHDVQIGSISLAFTDAAAGEDKTVQITGVTLVGVHAELYDVDVTCAPTAIASITPRDLTVSGLQVQAKAYDGTTFVTLVGTPAYAGLAANESFAVLGTASAVFTTPMAGAARAVSVTGFLVPSANYTIAQPAGLTGAILPRVVTVGGSFSAQNKVFDGNTTADVAQQALVLMNVITGDAVALSDVLVAFATASVGTSKPVSITNAKLVGAGSANYTLDLSNAPHTTAAIIATNPPSAPRSLAVDEGDRQITISWTAPAEEGCAAVNGWVVEYRVQGGAWSAMTLTSRLPMRATITALTNNLPVEVRVAAVNSCGMSAFADAGTFIPVGPTTGSGDNGGTSRPPSVTPGETQVRSGGQLIPVTTTIVQDTTVRVSGADFSLTLRAVDDGGTPIPVDSPLLLHFEHGGHAHTSGTGFAPGTLVTLYLYGATGEPMLLGRTTVLADGTFAHIADVPMLPAGDYTLQVNGINAAGTMRSIAVGVRIAPPPSDLELTAVPNTTTPSAGDIITITITVTNRGTGPALDVVIPRAFREAGFNLVAAVPQDGTYDTTSQLWQIPRIEAGGSARLLLTAIVQPPAPEFRP